MQDGIAVHDEGADCLVNSSGSLATMHTAHPIWVAGRHQEMNLTAGFRCPLAIGPGEGAVILRLAMRSFYRVWLDGSCVGCGPERSAHGHVRVDVYAWNLRPGAHLIAIEAQAVNAPAFSSLDEPPFVQAEVQVGGRLIAATGCMGWQALIPGHRLQRVPRLSRQRGFMEAWRLDPASDAWRQRADTVFTEVGVEPVASAVLQPRRLPLPSLPVVLPEVQIAAGTARQGTQAPLLKWETWMRQDSGSRFTGFPFNDWEADPSGEIATWACQREADPPTGPATAPFTLQAGTWRILDFGVIQVGFVRCRVECRQPAVLYLLGDEVLDPSGDVDARRLEFFNGVRYELTPGEYDLQSFEILTLRYLKVLVLSGEVSLGGIGMIAYARDLPDPCFAAADPRLDRLFTAAARTFAHNTVDNFLDCPSRERAGWLCDSFFTGRTEPWLTGGTAGETLFLENYGLCPALPDQPPGMLPRQYPGDQSMVRTAPGILCQYLPTWPMWLVLQVEEYVQRGGEPAVAERFRRRFCELLAFLDGFLGREGLLERLESWIFVDWSEANQHVQEVNFPVNLLYAASLEAAGRLYDRKDWIDRAAVMRRRVQELAWDGRFFGDNAVRTASGILERTGHHTEACQYYAFFFGAASPQTHPDLWRELLLRCSLAPGVVHPDLPRCGVFMGQQMRMLLLARHGHHRQLVEELIAGYLPMAERTGTLWEHETPKASCDHGFASHVAHVLVTAVFGLEVDRPARRFVLRPPNHGLPWCRIRLPWEGGVLELGWERDAEGPRPSVLRLPAGWTCDFRRCRESSRR